MLSSLVKLCCVCPQDTALPAVFRQKGFTLEPACSGCLRWMLRRLEHARGGLVKGLGCGLRSGASPSGLVACQWANVKEFFCFLLSFSKEQKNLSGFPQWGLLKFFRIFKNRSILTMIVFWHLSLIRCVLPMGFWCRMLENQEQEVSMWSPWNRWVKVWGDLGEDANHCLVVFFWQ